MQATTEIIDLKLRFKSINLVKKFIPIIKIKEKIAVNIKNIKNKFPKKTAFFSSEILGYNVNIGDVIRED